MAEQNGHWVKGPGGQSMPEKHRTFLSSDALRVYPIWKAYDNLKNEYKAIGSDSKTRMPATAAAYAAQLKRLVAKHEQSKREKAAAG